jgi:hypothetical protein
MITSAFGAWEQFRKDLGWGPHKGTDFGCPTGTDLLAVGGATVEFAGTSTFYPVAGKYVVLDHGHGLSSYYLHMDAIDVQEGERVTSGQLIGKSGATSSQNIGAHLHYALRFDGRYIDPVDFLQRKTALEVPDTFINGEKLKPIEAIVMAVDATVPAWDAELFIPYNVEIIDGEEYHTFRLDDENKERLIELAENAEF